MLSTSKVLAALLAGLLVAGSVACSSEPESNRWVTTENTNVKIDWDKVNQAYKDATGPEDLEKRVNEIYEGEEIISISVQDTDEKNQTVTGFFDKNKSGNIDEGEKIFTISRKITGEGTGEIQTTGHGPYYGYHSPLMSIATGMLLGSMLSNAFSPRYAPMSYATSPARASAIGAERASYRAANPSRFSKPSRTGRTYGGSPGRSSGGSRGGGGGRFGLARRGRTTRPVRLTD